MDFFPMLDGRFSESVKIWWTNFPSGRFYREPFYREPFYRGLFSVNHFTVAFFPWTLFPKFKCVTSAYTVFANMRCTSAFAGFFSQKLPNLDESNVNNFF